MEQDHFEPVVLARATEQLRQERETFDQAKKHEALWFYLRLVMGYASVVLLTAIMFIASFILFRSSQFSAGVVTTAAAALFADVLGLLVAVWKIVLNPKFYADLGPVTTVNFANRKPRAIVQTPEP
jgi:hypothetical protein